MTQPRVGMLRQEMPEVYACAYDRDLQPGVRYGPVIRDLFYFECNTGGYGAVIINGREFSVGPGDCYFIHPGDTVTYIADFVKPREGVWCAVDGMQVGRALAQAGITPEKPFAPRELFPALAAEMEGLAEMWEDTDPGAPLRRAAHICRFLGILLSNSGGQGRSDWLSRVMGYMEANYYRPITVRELAREAYLERSYFSVRFRELTGQAPHAFLTSLRVQKACSLMLHTRCSVSGAAELVGLDARNFARLFKRETGKTPREYLAEHSAGEDPGTVPVLSSPK